MLYHTAREREILRVISFATPLAGGFVVCQQQHLHFTAPDFGNGHEVYWGVHDVESYVNPQYMNLMVLPLLSCMHIHPLHVS